MKLTFLFRLLFWGVLGLTALTLSGCPKSLNDYGDYQVVAIDTYTVTDYSLITLKSQGDSLLIVLSPFSNTFPSKGDTGWVALSTNMRLRLLLTNYEPIPDVGRPNPYHPLGTYYCPPLTEQEFDALPDSVFEIDNLIGPRVLFWESGKVQCDLYRASEIAGSYVRKSAVVKGE